MTKHIIGFIVFSLIVGTSALVAGLFMGASNGTGFSSRNYDASFGSPDDNYLSKRKKRKKCRKKRRHPHPHGFDSGRSAQASVVTAVYDVHSGRLKTSFDFTRGTPEDFDLELQFFVKDEYGRRYIKTETIEGSRWTQNYEDDYDWMDRFEQIDKLWMTARIKDAGSGWTSPSESFSDDAVKIEVVNVKHKSSRWGSDPVTPAEGINLP
ncbi:MAG: hypothetical protein DWQ47_17840 [Acidobacteria bacterium]|nr:MAG: hypothetical protein DWQ32_05240 [Acidobacteriota bacterium]REK02105.1 MAG: hypothetical protein DWQ38_06915 [Acidobacteriota bacterium]REK14093.1 MAG: hypothetical protein DWQ43_10930 [Acidobacteriota bacterium]REK42088.1 MAG: hypothetical protein DWQ47_17840 [Acidobacteriota bacterium]